MHICQFLWGAHSRGGHFLLENCYLLTSWSFSSITEDWVSVSWKSFCRMTSNNRENYDVIFITLIIRLECLSISVNYLMALLSEIILAFDLPILSLSLSNEFLNLLVFQNIYFRLEQEKKNYTHRKNVFYDLVRHAGI